MRHVFIIGLVFLVGCSTTARLYPVEGPLSTQEPLPVIRATVSGIMGNNGGIALTMPDGERFEGTWSSAAGSGVGYSSMNLITQYGTVYGSGFNISPGQGQNPGRAFLVGDRGGRIDVEFITGAGTANGFGIAKDNRGNLYRVLF